MAAHVAARANGLATAILVERDLPHSQHMRPGEHEARFGMSSQPSPAQTSPDQTKPSLACRPISCACDHPWYLSPDLSPDRTPECLMDQTEINQSINHQSINQSISQSVNQSVSESISQYLSPDPHSRTFLSQPDTRMCLMMEVRVLSTHVTSMWALLTRVDWHAPLLKFHTCTTKEAGAGRQGQGVCVCVCVCVCCGPRRKAGAGRQGQYVCVCVCVCVCTVDQEGRQGQRGRGCVCVCLRVCVLWTRKEVRAGRRGEGVGMDCGPGLPGVIGKCGDLPPHPTASHLILPVLLSPTHTPHTLPTIHFNPPILSPSRQPPHHPP